MHGMRQEQRSVSFEVGAGDLDVRVGGADVVLPRQHGTHLAVAVLVVDR